MIFSNKLSDLMNDRGTLRSDLLSPSNKKTNPEHTSFCKLVKDADLNWMKDLLIKKQ